MQKNTSIIPKGPYCYTWKELPSKENNFRGQVNLCPYFQVKNIDGVEFPWCDYLELGGLPGDGGFVGWSDYKKAIEVLSKHFGGEDKMDEALPLFLLFDQCKECGIDDEDEICGTI